MTDLPTIDDPRWPSVLARDAEADGQFVFAVRTTGVYCRPSCPARRAKPENIRFFSGPAEAEAAGFRPCLRCCPDGPLPQIRQAGMVDRACRLLADQDPVASLSDLAAQLGVSASYLQRQFKAQTGLSPKQWALAQRGIALRQQLGTGSGSVTDALYRAGYNAPSRFYDQAPSVLGMAPRVYRKGGEGIEIRFAIAQSDLGAVLVAQSDKGLCAIAMGDDPQTLIDQFQDRFPKAQLIGEDRTFQRMVAQVIAFIEAPQIGLDLPLDLRGTAFQLRVWQALRQIPAGQTVTYTELARRLGTPRSVRAVANACGANKLAVAVPCHRVLRLDGSLSGYRWGVDRKRRLLDQESLMSSDDL